MAAIFCVVVDDNVLFWTSTRMAWNGLFLFVTGLVLVLVLLLGQGGHVLMETVGGVHFSACYQHQQHSLDDDYYLVVVVWFLVPLWL